MLLKKNLFLVDHLVTYPTHLWSYTNTAIGRNSTSRSDAAALSADIESNGECFTMFYKCFTVFNNVLVCLVSHAMIGTAALAPALSRITASATANCHRDWQ